MFVIGVDLPRRLILLTRYVVPYALLSLLVTVLYISYTLSYILTQLLSPLSVEVFT